MAPVAVRQAGALIFQTTFAGRRTQSQVRRHVTARQLPADVGVLASSLECCPVYAVNGVRVVGFDDERGKGDHCHLHGSERPYRFTTVDALIEEFIAAVEAARSKP
jgi:hypothetical protein